MPARQIIENSEENNRAMRFDLGNCRIEVWVSEADIKNDPFYEQIMQRVAGAKLSDKGAIMRDLENLAVGIAEERLSNPSGAPAGTIEITCDGNLRDAININRVDWEKLATADEDYGLPAP